LVGWFIVLAIGATRYQLSAKRWMAAAPWHGAGAAARPAG
jgi:hypothetical protein